MTSITSIDAQFTQAQIKKSSSGISESAANLSSGQKLNANVADLSVGTVLRTRVSTLRTTVINAGQAKSLLSTAKGALETIGDLLQQQKSLATKAADDSLTFNERGFLNQEFQAITAEIDRIADNTNFNGKSLIDGSISGQAALNSTTNESVENYTLVDTGDFAIGGVTTGLTTLSTSPFGAVNTDAVGAVRAEATLTFTFGASEGATLTINGEAITYSISGSATQAATNFVAAANAATGGATEFSYIDNGDGTVRVVANEVGDVVNALNFVGSDIDNGNGNALTLGTTSLDNATTNIGAAAGVTVGVDRNIASADRTYNETLLGGFSDFSVADVSVGSDGLVSATFTVEVNGTTYTSQAVNLFGGAASTGGAVTGQIRAGEVITFIDGNGPTNSGGELTDNAFTLTTGSSAYNVTIGSVAYADNADVITGARSDLDDFATSIQSELDGLAITQDRAPNLATVSTSDPDIVAAQGTFLDGIHGYDEATNAQGDILFRTDAFGTDSVGSIGSVGSFSFNKDTGLLTTTIDGITYSADLTDTTSNETTTGTGFYTGTAYVPSSGAFVTDGTIVLTTEDTSDGRQLRIDLGTSVNGGADVTVTVSTETAETEFSNTFNQLFGVAENDSLSFQVGVAATDAIGVSLSSSKTSALYLNDDGVAQSLDITTLANAQTASGVLDNAINNNISLIAEVEATITRFDSAIENNLTSIQNADAARSNLLDTDFSAESTTFAENRVRQDAAVSVLAQLNQRIQNLLQLLR